MQRKWIVLTGILLLALSGTIAYQKYQKPRVGVEDKKPDYTLSAIALYKDFSNDENAANAKYINKVIEVSGELADIKNDDNRTTIYLKATEAGGINCSLKSKLETLVPINSKVKIKGRCTGFLMDVNLVDGVLIQ